VPQHELLSPVQFIARERISIWFSVPSIISRLMRLKLLKPNSFPSLRLSLFCGEVLSEQAVKAWQKAAPNSRIENLYGPTEATVACFNFTCGCSGESVVPIGRPFPGTLAAVVNENFEFLTANQRGELLLAGAQVSPGYCLRPDLTAEKFITLMHPTLGLQRWYRTGDLVIQDQQQIFHYLARIDNQVKVAGFRIELEEVESHLKKLLVSDEVALTAIQYAGETRLVAVLCLPDINIAQIKSALKTYLPDYMIPHFWHVLPCLPYNQNDKIDRKQLNKCIQQIFAEPV
jgi:non-ribosomal peptide synthetase component F